VIKKRPPPPLLMSVWLSDLVIEKFRIIISDASGASNRVIGVFQELAFLSIHQFSNRVIGVFQELAFLSILQFSNRVIEKFRNRYC
jgi:hypothetical protein